MAVLTYSAGDSEPSYDFVVYDRNGSALDMTSAVGIEFRAKLTTGSTTITRTCSFVDKANGRAKAVWQTTDLATVGIYNMTVRVYWSGTTRWSTHPNNTYDVLVIIREVQA